MFASATLKWIAPDWKEHIYLKSNTSVAAVKPSRVAATEATPSRRNEEAQGAKMLRDALNQAQGKTSGASSSSVTPSNMNVSLLRLSSLSDTPYELCSRFLPQARARLVVNDLGETS